MRKKVLSAISTIAMALVMFMLPVFSTLDCSFRTKSQNDYTAQTRTVSADNSAIDFESVFKEYDDANLTQDGSLTTFEGNQTLKLDELELEDEELDEEDLKILENEEVTIRYKYTFDYVTDKVTLTAVMVETTSGGELSETIIDVIEGKAFINDAGEIDAELDLDGETILLSELQDLGVVDNCGLFKKLWKKVTTAVKKVTNTAIGVVGAVATVVVPAAIGVACAVTGVGLVATVVAGAVAGAAIAASTAAASTAQQDGKVDWETVGVCAGVGGVVGAVVSGASYGITKAVQAANAAKSTVKTGPSSEVKSFDSYSAFKKEFGKASDYIPDGEWHHIVEQQTVEKGINAGSSVYNSKNTVAISKNLHHKVSGYYSSLYKNGQTFRQYVNTLPYEQQYAEGLKVLTELAKQFGETIIWL